jgi:uncharacterized protein YkwD
LRPKITLQQRAHLCVVQVFLRLQGETTERGRTLGALAAAVLALAGALAALLACAAPRVARAARTDAATPATACAGANLLPSAANARAVDAATLCLIDQLRSARGLRPLRANRELAHVATSQVTSMVRDDYFADDRPSGQTPMALVAVTHYPAHAARVAVGQNIAWGTGVDATPAHIVAEWMASPPHREVMLSGSYRNAGVGVTPAVPELLRTSDRGATYAIEFGARRA